MKELERTANALLLGHLSLNLKAQIDQLLAKGASKQAILSHCQRLTSANKGHLTMRAIELYLDQH